MTVRLRLGALAACGIAAWTAPVLAQTPVALVIGNASYAGQPALPTCEVSANLVSATLSRAGVKVTRLDNPSNARTVSALEVFGDAVAAAPNGRALVYFCGYVATNADRLFLLPVEARLDRPTDLLSQGILARQLVGAAAAPDSQAALVLMDTAVLPGKADAAAPDFPTLVRPAEAAHTGLAVATLPPTAMGAAPLASALADVLGTRQLELLSGLKAMQAQPGMGRSLVALVLPGEASWFVGNPAAGPTAAAAAVPAPAPAPSPTLAGPAAPAAPAEPNPAERRRLQLALQRLGYFKGRVTGVFGADTLNAIRQFQRESNSEATGRLTPAQVEQLLQ